MKTRNGTRFVAEMSADDRLVGWSILREESPQRVEHFGMKESLVASRENSDGYLDGAVALVAKFYRASTQMSTEECYPGATQCSSRAERLLLNHPTPRSCPTSWLDPLFDLWLALWLAPRPAPRKCPAPGLSTIELTV